MSKKLTKKEFNQLVKDFSRYLHEEIKTNVPDIQELNKRLSGLDKFLPKVEREERGEEEILEELYKGEEEAKAVTPIKSSNLFLGRLILQDRLEFLITQLDENFKKTWLKSHVAPHWIWKNEPEKIKEIFSPEKDEDASYWFFLTERWAPYLTSRTRMEKLLEDITRSIQLGNPEHSILPYLRIYRDASGLCGVKTELAFILYRTSVFGRINYGFDLASKSGNLIHVIGVTLRHHFDTAPLFLQIYEDFKDLLWTPEDVIQLYRSMSIVDLLVKKKLTKEYGETRE
jgi:hypothetical protein